MFSGKKKSFCLMCQELLTAERSTLKVNNLVKIKKTFYGFSLNYIFH